MNATEADQHQKQTIAQLEAEQAVFARKIGENCQRLRIEALESKPECRRTIWHWLFSFLPMFLLIAAASAETIITDAWGNVLMRLPWPSDRTVVLTTLVNGTMPAMRPTATPPPSATPIPIFRSYVPTLRPL